MRLKDIDPSCQVVRPVGSGSWRIGLLVLGSLAACQARPDGIAASRERPSPAIRADHAAWVSEVNARVLDASHAFVPDGGGFRVRVHEQGLAATFDGGRVALQTQQDSFSVQTAAIGRTGHVNATAPDGPTLGACIDGMSDPTGACIRRVEDRLAPGWTEWWVARSDGLEQGWVLDKRPPGEGELELQITVTGAKVTLSSGGVALRGASGSVVRLRGLLATDARGERVPTRFQSSRGGFRVVVDDVDAEFPLSIDPVYTTSAWEIEGIINNSPFSEAVAIVGDVNGDGYDDLIAGARDTNDYSGAAYLYMGSPSGPDSTATTMLAPGIADEYFGYAVSRAGDVNGDGYDDVIVGAHRNDSNRGRVVVYYGAPTGLSEEDCVELADGDAGSWFGSDVASAGDIDADGFGDILVGAYMTNGLDGAVFLYRGGPSGLDSTPTTLAGPAGATDFGYSVAGAGDLNGDGYDDIAIGGPAANALTGEVSIYEGSAGGIQATASATLAGGASFDLFGWAVDGAGDVDGDGFGDLIVGAEAYSSGGGAFVYSGSSTGVLTTPSAVINGVARSGYSVAGAGDVNGDGYADVVVGDYGVDGFVYGHAFVYLGSPLGLDITAVSDLQSGGDINDHFAASVDGDGDVNGDGLDDIFVGEWGIPGAAYVFAGDPSGPSGTATTVLPGSTVEQLGVSVSSAGDVNADGYDDVIVGAYEYMAYVGRAYVYLGTPTGLAPTAATTLTGEREGGYFGESVAGIGDVNQDGFDDVAVGAWGYGFYQGRVYVYEGSAAGTSSTPAITLGDTTPNGLGESVAGAGDVNADGYDDMIVSAYYADEAWIYHGSATGIGASPDEVLSVRYPADVAGLGDVNGDAFDDVGVGSNRLTGADSGDAYVFHGSATGVGSTAISELPGVNAGDLFGRAVAGAGDVDGDGYADVIVGAYGYGHGNAYVYAGSPTGVLETPSQTLTGTIPDAEFGYAVAGVGDVDGDGYDDVAVGAWAVDGGAIYLYPGGAAGLPATELETISGLEDLGDAVCNAGDVNGDGRPDLLVGTRFANLSAGAAYLYLGDADADADGVRSTSDCDDHDPSATLPFLSYADADSDGFGDPAAPSAAAACESDVGYVADATDCDDGDAAVHPGGAPICDGSGDGNCNGAPDTSDAWYLDADADGYGDIAETTPACDPADGYVAEATDCDDRDPGTHPGAAEACDDLGADEDCNGLADDADTTASGKATAYEDGDADGFGSAAADFCVVPTGYVSTSTDCDDADATIHPGATELCDASSTDEDCNGLADDDDPAATAMSPFYADSDGDGFGSGASTERCHLASGYSVDVADCDDADAAVNPSATELCDAANSDEDCDGLADDDDPSATGFSTWYADADSDGYGGSSVAARCDLQPGYTADSTDCDDAVSGVHPGATEACDAANADEDCNGVADDADVGATGKTSFYADADGDGYGAGPAVPACDAGSGLVANDADCDDGSASNSPFSTEIVGDGVDQDCNGSETCFADVDVDGFRSPSSTTTSLDADCDDAGEALGSAALDCDDADESIGSSTEIVGDGIDEDCDGVELCYVDKDGDGYHPDDVTVPSDDLDCSDPGEADIHSVGGDCADTSSGMHPGAAETDCTDPIDYNCDGSWGRMDNDRDGYDACKDCDDSARGVNPDADDVCNEVDDDCSGVIDDGEDVPRWCLDIDQDGYTDPAACVTCTGEAGYLEPTADDCDDTDASISPAGTEIAGDDVDQDCDGRDLGTGTIPHVGGERPCGCAAGQAPVGSALAVALGLLVGRWRRDRERSERSQPGDRSVGGGARQAAWFSSAGGAQG